MNSTGDAAKSTETRLVGSQRVLAVLSELARHPEGVGLDELARALGSAKSTIHRALASLKQAQFAKQDGRGNYILGDEFLRLAFAHHEARPDHVRVRPILDALALRFGETVHYAVLTGRSITYRSKVDPAVGSIKLTSMVGGQNPAHSTGVGKLLLAFALPDDGAVRKWVGNRRLERLTEDTITTADELSVELAKIRRLGYGVDDQENEIGVNCVALPVFLTSQTTPSGAVSVSGLTYRTPLQTLVDDIDEFKAILGTHLSSN